MTDKRLKIASFITQGVYMLACAADIVMCLMYRMCWDTPSGRILADAAMYLTCDLALLPVLPALLILNICIAVRDREHRGRWILWTVVSAILCVVSCLAASVMFVSSTGGV